MYPEIMVIPMREELTRAGINETRTAEDVDAALAQPGTTLLVVNSICGCAAGKMRPGVRLALANTANAPDHKITVFAGQDREATEKARSYFEGHPPTSPAIAILRDGKLVYLMQRFVIEQATAQQIAGELDPRIRRILRKDDCLARGKVAIESERPPAKEAVAVCGRLLSVALHSLWFGQLLHLAVFPRIAEVNDQPNNQPADHHFPRKQHQARHQVHRGENAQDRHQRHEWRLERPLHMRDGAHAIPTRRPTQW